MVHAPISDHSSSAADLVYAVNESGKVIHISEVVSGLACNCRCPGCGISVVAKKGSEVTHHFAHEADSSCRVAAETALHRLAKEIIEHELKLWLPAVIARSHKRTRQLYAAGDVSFTRAQSEARHLHEVVPDLLIERGDRKLLVEIWVTHPCDEAKRNELRKKGIATLEIDLSRFPRHASRAEIENAVLKGAPRHWVYHPKIEAEIAAMRALDAAAKQREKEVFEKRVEKAEVDYRAGLQALATRQPNRLDRRNSFFRAGYGRFIGIAVDGAGCFTVSLREWQFYILHDAFAQSRELEPSAYRVKNLFEWFKKRKLIRRTFNYVAPDIEEALTARGIGFLSPYRSIEKYLEELSARGVLHKHQAYYSAPGIVDAMKKLREADERRDRYRQSLIDNGEKILQMLPQAERQSLTGASWLNVPQSNGVSLAEVLDCDDPSLAMVFFKLRAIENMIFSKGAVVDETLGLPIAMERERQRAARQAEVDARERDRLKALRDAEEARIERLKGRAKEHLQTDSEAWLSTVNRELGNKLPLDLARGGERELDQVLAVLDREISRRRQEEERQQRLIDLRSELESRATSILGAAARPFLASPYPELGHKRPNDYCVSHQAMQVCLKLAERVRRARR